MNKLFYGLLVALLAMMALQTARATEPGKERKKRVVYRNHTQLDFSGDTIQGKVRAPEVFYIFQRKRSEAHHVIHTPGKFDYHFEATQVALRKALPK